MGRATVCNAVAGGSGVGKESAGPRCELVAENSTTGEAVPDGVLKSRADGVGLASAGDASLVKGAGARDVTWSGAAGATDISAVGVAKRAAVLAVRSAWAGSARAAIPGGLVNSRTDGVGIPSIPGGEHTTVVGGEARIISR